ncbi:MAG: hypothetical protein WCA84_10825 [Ignavibacteriaceae bacterium]
MHTNHQDSLYLFCRTLKTSIIVFYRFDAACSATLLKKPITIENPDAIVHAGDCLNMDANAFNLHK